MYEVELEEYTDVQDSEREYPFAVLDGVTSEDEVEFFRSISKDDSISIPLYCRVEDTLLSLGKIDLCLNSLLNIRSIYPYGLQIYKSESDVRDIDLNDAETLIKFIRL